ncbi:MAG TPA: BON domain-containing protein [Candidatus Polarisedimenticolia bacterium]|nr:BON domain-containing protein [Candidatus Polarisedimenticolia bacterium]
MTTLMETLKRSTMAAASGLLLLGVVGCTKANNPREEARIETNKADDANQAAAGGADNTARNANDMNEPTSFDQGTSEADRELTQKVRQGVMDDDSLSTTAKNVKIITREGKVLLRGPVSSAEERARIESIAAGVAGTGNVTNELAIDTRS